MPTADKTNLKQVLRDECLPALGGQSKYYNAEAVNAWLQKRKLRCPPATLNRYLHEFTRAGLVFAAGRGWYSSLATPFALNREPVSSLVQELNKTFPLLEFSCWSTQQVNPYMHHLLGKFVAFVQTDPDALESVFEFLRDAGYDAHLNPTGQEKKRFMVRQKTVVVRRRTSGAPTDGHFASIESILVDLYLETNRLGLMDLEEFRGMARRLVASSRIEMSSLVSYAERREQSLKDIFGSAESIISDFFKNPELIDSP